jgi:hypothetical protein
MEILVKALNTSNQAIYEFLIKESNEKDILKLAIHTRDDITVLSKFIHLIPNINNYKALGTTLLIEACNCKIEKTDLVKFLLRNKANPNIYVDRNTPLICAVKQGHLETAKLLIENDAWIDFADAYKDTALHWAVFRDSVELVKFLLDNGASLYKVNSENKKPADYAKSKEVRDYLNHRIKYLNHIKAAFAKYEIKRNAAKQETAQETAQETKTAEKANVTEKATVNEKANVTEKVAVNEKANVTEKVAVNEKAKAPIDRILSSEKSVYFAMFENPNFDPYVEYKGMPFVFYCLSNKKLEQLEHILMNPNLDFTKKYNGKTILDYFDMTDL